MPLTFNKLSTSIVKFLGCACILVFILSFQACFIKYYQNYLGLNTLHTVDNYYDAVTDY